MWRYFHTTNTPSAQPRLTELSLPGARAAARRTAFTCAATCAATCAVGLGSASFVGQNVKARGRCGFSGFTPVSSPELAPTRFRDPSGPTLATQRDVATLLTLFSPPPPTTPRPRLLDLLAEWLNEVHPTKRRHVSKRWPEIDEWRPTCRSCRHMEQMHRSAPISWTHPTNVSPTSPDHAVNTSTKAGCL